MVSCQQFQQVQQIKKAVENQMIVYPLSTLQDIYKNFFQDRFGPGHIISDSTSAGIYLREELNSQPSFSGIMYEPCGYLGSFYRVNLSVLKEGLIDYKTYFDVFLRSVNRIKPMPIDEWIKEWEIIERVVVRKYPDLPNLKKDRENIQKILASGQFAVHHSEVYTQAYDPHYRIIDKQLFESEIKPFLTIK